jgi:phenol hydroxylase P4 protein
MLAGVLPGVLATTPTLPRSTGQSRMVQVRQSPGNPMPAKTLAENGLVHKDVIRFRTPGLNGLNGSCN